MNAGTKSLTFWKAGKTLSNNGGNGMEASDPTAAGYELLRKEAVGNPKRAREMLTKLIKGPARELEQTLERASRPGEGRVRQVVATAYRLMVEGPAVLRPWLEKWLADEPDEFAKRALRAATDARSILGGHAELPPAPTELPRNIAATYRYVTERLCHKIRNSLGLPDTQLVRLTALIGTVQDPSARASLTEILAGLRSGFERIAKLSTSSSA